MLLLLYRGCIHIDIERWHEVLVIVGLKNNPKMKSDAMGVRAWQSSPEAQIFEQLQTIAKGLGFDVFRT